MGRVPRQVERGSALCGKGLMSSISFEQRCIGAFLGLAVGDALGRPLEFLRGARVRTEAVSLTPGVFRWTDDTHMALYLARAILDVGAFDEDRFGHAVGKRFVEWSHDPLTPSTAPGGTCLAGTASYARGGDWRTSGVVGSDGCGAVMRIAPLAMAFDGATLTRAAEISASVTHLGVDALEAAIAASHLLRWVLEGEAFDAALVQRAIDDLRGPWNRGGAVASALEAAISLGARTGDAWLDESAIPHGDGGWRSASALGLAVAAALRWQHDPRLAIERAARIDGDSDSVACLVGMFLGGAGGVAALPPEMVAVVPDRSEIERLARALAGPLASSRPAPSTELPVVAVADLHGQRDRLVQLLAHWDRELGADYRVVLLGDYVDNGPAIPQLLDLLVELERDRGDRFAAILGNHDLACVRSMGWDGGPADESWFARWVENYGGRSTASAYGARSGAELAYAMPAAHRDFLQRRPWFVDDGTHLFVHAGLERGAIEPQLATLRDRPLLENGHTHAALREKALAVIADPSWSRIVVSGHTRRPIDRAKGEHDASAAPHFVTATRVTVSASVDSDGTLWSVLLPDRRFVAVRADGALERLPR